MVNTHLTAISNNIDLLRTGRNSISMVGHYRHPRMQLCESLTGTDHW